MDLVDVEHIIRNGHNNLSILKGDGDFRSQECLDLLDEADIVVTNPPFSLFREFIDTIVEHGKQFIVLGSQNAITYKNVFSLLKEDKVWLGGGLSTCWFKVPDSYEERPIRFRQDPDGQKYISLGNICWFTNMEHARRHEKLILFRDYSPEAYPKYDNYNAIEVGKVADIPCDYDGAMGVPITYMLKHNPDQFEIVGHTHLADTSPEVEALRTDPEHRHGGMVKGKEKYMRILIRRK